MTISRVNTAGFGVGDTLTNTQANDIDLNPTYALDKRSGNTDTLSSVVSLAVAGRIVENVAVGANANTTYAVGAANRVIQVTSAVTANRNYTLSSTACVTGDQITVYCAPSFVTYEIAIKDQASATMYTLGNLASSDGQWATFIYVAGWRLFRASGAKHHSQTFTSNGTWTCPANVFVAYVEGCGAGGGGAVGDSAFPTTTDKYGTGGGGGGGAALCVQTVAVTPGVVYTVTTGVGGAAGTAGTDTTFDTLATFCGASGGAASAQSNTGTLQLVAGGSPVRLNPQTALSWQTTSPISIAPPGAGGYGANNLALNTYATGYRNTHGGFAAGAGGSVGTDSGTYRGGGPGGGGGAGPYGAGGAGGAGGSGNNAGVGGAGIAGTAAGANTGAGGGGSGSLGRGTVGGSVGAGGAGGSGQLTIRWVK